MKKIDYVNAGIAIGPVGEQRNEPCEYWVLTAQHKDADGNMYENDIPVFGKKPSFKRAKVTGIAKTKVVGHNPDGSELKRTMLWPVAVEKASKDEFENVYQLVGDFANWFVRDGWDFGRLAIRALGQTISTTLFDRKGWDLKSQFDNVLALSGITRRTQGAKLLVEGRLASQEYENQTLGIVEMRMNVIANALPKILSSGINDLAAITAAAYAEELAGNEAADGDSATELDDPVVA